MNIILGKTAGFCFGVKNAVTKAQEATKNSDKISCLGELVHNTQVTEKLKKDGIEFIDNIEEAEKTAIIRSHGAEKQVYEKAEELGIKLIDLTCPKVLRIHNIVQKYVNEGYFIIITGKKEHPEMVSTLSFCPDSYFCIESEDDLSKAINEYKKSKKNKVLLISQTTYSLEKFNKIAEELKKHLEEMEIINTICNATKERQEETEKLAKHADCMIIIGGKHSSNSNKLYDIARKYCKNTQFIETAEELETDSIKLASEIGVMAGASTPEESIKDVIEKLTKLC